MTVAPLPSSMISKLSAAGPIRRTRRRHERVEIVAPIEARLLDLELSGQVRNVSEGGFSLGTDEPVEFDKPHLVLFATADGWSTTLTVIARHAGPGADCAHVTGFEFTDKHNPKTGRAITELLDRLTVIAAQKED